MQFKWGCLVCVKEYFDFSCSTYIVQLCNKCMSSVYTWPILSSVNIQTCLIKNSTLDYRHTNITTIKGDNIWLTTSKGTVAIEYISRNVLQSSGISWKLAALIERYTQKKGCISFVFYCFENLSIVITLESLVRFRWGFQQNVPLLMRTSIK